MREAVKRKLPASWQPAIRGRLNRARNWYLLWRYSFTTADLLDALRRCGIAEGDVVLVHSSYHDFGGFRGGVLDVIRVLEAAVGPRGTLLMPTLSMQGSAVSYARQNPVFDPRRTPSKVGMINEVFRRLEDVKRSLHPTHSVAGSGKDADALLEDHHLADTPCGRGTPYHRLIEKNGKVVLLNTGFGAFTLYHCIEELIEPLLPFSPFTEQRYVFGIRDGSRVLESAAMRLFDPGISARRNLGPLQARLKRTGAWREASVGNIRIIVVAGGDALTAAEELAREGVYCYDIQLQPQAR